MKHSLDKLLGHLDELDTTNLAAFVQRLARQRSLLEAVCNAVSEGIIVIEPPGTIAYANAAAQTFIGLGEGNAEADTPIWKHVPGLAQVLGANAAGILETSASVLSREIELTYPELRRVRLTCIPLNENDKHTEKRFCLLFNDITADALNLEERLSSERYTSIFGLAAGVAHELGNPLNAIGIHLQLAQRELQKLQKCKEADTHNTKNIEQSLAVCQQEVARLDGILHNFLGAMRPESTEFKPIHLLDIIESTLSAQSAQMEQLGIRAEVNVEGTLPKILGEPGQLTQAFFNLTKNAIEAMPSGGTLAVSARVDDASVYVHIADTGVGIAPSAVAQVFEAHSTTKQGGHGLGMLIVQRTLQLHGGTLGITSNPGQGTIVTVQLPREHKHVRLLEKTD